MPEITAAATETATILKARPGDGTGANTANPSWGSTGTELLRLAPDANGENNEMSGSDRTNAREISNAVAQQTETTVNAAGASDFLWIWGQFLDHDLSLTEAGHTETANIAVPAGDPFFDPLGAGNVEIGFTRVDQHDGAYVNEITAFIDASMIYGSDQSVIDSMRADGGMLVMTEEAQLHLEGVTLLTGDVRAAENIALSSMHTIFTREHNRIVEELAIANPEMTDDALFNMARAQVEAIVQAITYNEFLPILIGEGQIEAYDGYDPSVDPSISAEFSTAVFRLGHTLLSSNLQKVGEDGSSTGQLALRDAFFRPSLLTETDMIEDIFRGAATQTAQAVDNMVVEDVRSFLFGPPGAGGFDLAALNIQRGRDLGIASYNDLREAIGLARAKSFGDITSDADLAARLEAVYQDVDLVDAWVGGLAEDPVEGALLGEAFSTIMIDQFTRLRDGDAYWSEGREGLSEAQVDALWSTTLSDVIIRNTDVEAMQSNVFMAMNRLAGTDGADRLTGTNADDFVFGADGQDVLLGGRGADELQGGTGNDQLFGGRGKDLLFGGEGNDKLVGNRGHDTLNGNAGNDMLTGGRGQDTLDGGTGNDMLKGGRGQDTLDGGAGNDILFGGLGADVFIIDLQTCGHDVIRDFEIGNDDLLYINSSDGITAYSEIGDDVVLTFDAQNSVTFTGLADEITLQNWEDYFMIYGV